MTTAKEDREFIAAMISDSLLEEAIQWIAGNLDPEEIVGRDALEEWAAANGYVDADTHEQLQDKLRDAEDMPQ